MDDWKCTLCSHNLNYIHSISCDEVSIHSAQSCFGYQVFLPLSNKSVLFSCSLLWCHQWHHVLLSLTSLQHILYRLTHVGCIILQDWTIFSPASRNLCCSFLNSRKTVWLKKKIAPKTTALGSLPAVWPPDTTFPSKSTLFPWLKNPAKLSEVLDLDKHYVYNLLIEMALNK